jgi:glycerol-3-phosphate cytidylyltransferase
MDTITPIIPVKSNVRNNIVLTFGTFDLFHNGHIKLLKRAAEYGDLYVGVSTDWFSSIKKGLRPVNNFATRMKNIKNLYFVKGVFAEESMEKKKYYITKYKANILIMGDDWKNKFNHVGCRVIYLPRTPNISSTKLKRNLNLPILTNKLKLHGTYKHPLTNSSEIFPLKKYNFYGYKIYGPNRYDTMNNFYSKSYPMMKYGKVKWDKHVKHKKYKKYFKLQNFAPAKYNRNSTKINAKCFKNTTSCFHRPKKNRYIETKNNIKIAKCCRHHLNDMLLFTVELLEKHRIPYFIYWGTLLGCLRHKGSIPWDTDHDIYILDSYVHKLNTIIPIINKKYHFSKVKKNFFRVNYSTKNRAHVDIYVAEQIPNKG